MSQDAPRWLLGILGSFRLIAMHAKILIVGLENSGKSTLLRRLKYGTFTAKMKPSGLPNTEVLPINKTRCIFLDLGGNPECRKGWKNYFPGTDGIVFVVDASDRGRFVEARTEMEALLSLPELANVPFVILGNKIDESGAAADEELRSALHIRHHYGRVIRLYMCSFAKERGYKEALDWLIQYLW